MFTETDERNAWLALKSTVNRILREIETLNNDGEVLQANVETLEQIRTERSQQSLPDKMVRRGLYADESGDVAADVRNALDTINRVPLVTSARDGADHATD